MGVMLNVQDETSSGQLISESQIEFPVECVTVMQLIEARVTQEVESYNERMGGEFTGLVQPTESERMLNGYRLRRGKSIDIEKQIATALKAFESNGFFLLVNDSQVTDLNDKIIITPNAVVVFLKLVPLVGG